MIQLSIKWQMMCPWLVSTPCKWPQSSIIAGLTIVLKHSPDFHLQPSMLFPARWTDPAFGACVWGSTTWIPPWTFPLQRNAIRWMVSSATRASSTNQIKLTSLMTSPWCIWASLSIWRGRSAPSVCRAPGQWCLLAHPALSPAGEMRKVGVITPFSVL